MAGRLVTLEIYIYEKRIDLHYMLDYRSRMNWKYMKRLGISGLIVGLTVSATGISLGILPVILVGVSVLAATFVLLQVGWFLPPN